MIDANKISALVNWLAAGAPPKRNFSDLIAEVGKRLVSAGLPIDQFGVYVTMIDPEIPCRFVFWSEAAGSRNSTLTPDQLRMEDLWIGSPAHTCQKTGRMVVHKFGSSPEYDGRGDTRHLASRGYQEFVHTPLHSSYTLVTSAASYGTKKESGFDKDEIHALRVIQAHLARVVECFVLHEGTVQVLSTYVGRGAGSRVLAGNILRGDTETIPSIVLFTDLRDFTAHSNARPASLVIETLNIFYDFADIAIGKNGGKILKFMGDGLLAIFPTPDDLAAQIAASTGAIAALEETRAALADGQPGSAAARRCRRCWGENRLLGSVPRAGPGPDDPSWRANIQRVRYASRDLQHRRLKQPELGQSFGLSAQTRRHRHWRYRDDFTAPGKRWLQRSWASPLRDLWPKPAAVTATA